MITLLFSERAKNILLSFDFQILYRWHIRSNVSMQGLVQSMVDWQNNGCLDPGVWESFLRHQLDSALAPAPSELQLLAPPDKSFKQIMIKETVNIIGKFYFC